MRSIVVSLLIFGFVGVAHAQEIDRIVFGSCSDQRKPLDIFDVMAAEEPDLVLLMGDNVYGDVSGPEMTELKDAYAVLAAAPEFARLSATAPILAAWDDHDYGVNDGGADFPWRAESKALFLAAFPPAEEAMTGRDGTYQAAVFGTEGRRVQVIVLDTRWFRSPLLPTDERDAPGKERYLPDPDPAKTMLGEAQWAWLADRLREPADLRIVVSSVQVLADGHGFERWGNLPLERERLIGLIGETGARGVVLLSGDRHVAALYRRNVGTPYPIYEVTSSSLNRPWKGDGHRTEPDPWILGAFWEAANYGRIEIDWQRNNLTLALVDSDGVTVRQATIGLEELHPEP